MVVERWFWRLNRFGAVPQRQRMMTGRCHSRVPALFLIRACSDAPAAYYPWALDNVPSSRAWKYYRCLLARRHHLTHLPFPTLPTHTGYFYTRLPHLPPRCYPTPPPHTPTTHLTHFYTRLRRYRCLAYLALLPARLHRTARLPPQRAVVDVGVHWAGGGGCPVGGGGGGCGRHGGYKCSMPICVACRRGGALRYSASMAAWEMVMSGGYFREGGGGGRR